MIMKFLPVIIINHPALLTGSNESSITVFRPNAKNWPGRKILIKLIGQDAPAFCESLITSNKTEACFNKGKPGNVEYDPAF